MAKTPTATTILAERLGRHALSAPLTDKTDYVELFRALQPVSPVHFSCPGDPPALSRRTEFNGALEANRLRQRGRLVKGRFLGDRLGYVWADDLAIYGNAFRRPLGKATRTQQTLLDTLAEVGPLTPRQIKDETGLLNKQIMPALHRLQKAFAVYEDQIDSDWERSWHRFESEWPDIELSEDHRAPAAVEVLMRFIRAHVFATLEQIKDWSQLPARALPGLLGRLTHAGQIVAATVDGLGEGWACSADVGLSARRRPRSIFMLHKADPLVRSHASELKRRFGGSEVLQYLLIDGVFAGAVLGHWRIGPHDVDDIVVTLPTSTAARRRKGVLAEVAREYAPPRSRILRYNGRA